jgi:hypothetical protein
MNRNEIFAVIEPLDVYTQLACLGSMQYGVSSEAIRRAIKLIPDHPTAETIEAFLNEERNNKVDVTYTKLRALGEQWGAEVGERVPLQNDGDVHTTPGNQYDARRELSALLDLRRDIADRSDELGATAGGEQMEERTLLNTMQFMLSQKKPDPAYFARQYTNNMRLGIKNYGQTRAQFVQQEMERAATDLDTFLAKGEHAVQFLEGLDLIEGAIDERLMESLARRCVNKLIARRIKIGQSLSWRADMERRLEAQSDILFIEKAIEALGGEVPAECVAEPEVDAPSPAPATSDLLAQFAAFIASQQKQDPKAPGPVTITH